MQQARRWELLPVIVLGAIVAWRAWSEISLFLVVADAPAAAVSRKPLVLFWGPVLVATLAVGLVAIHAAWKGGDARRVRVLYLLAFLTLVLDIFLLPSTRLPPIVTSDLLAESALEQARARLLLEPGPGLLPAEASALEKALEGGIPPQYLERGEEVEQWRVVLVPDCTEPVLEVGDRPVGTIIYCLASDRRSGSLTVVGTGGALAGPPAMAVGMEGPVSLPLKALLPPEDGAPGAPEEAN